MSRQLTFPRPPIVVSSSLRRDRRGNFDGPYCCGVPETSTCSRQLESGRRGRSVRGCDLRSPEGPPIPKARVALPFLKPYIGCMVSRTYGRRRPLNAPAAFIHPCQPIVAKAAAVPALSTWDDYVLLCLDSGAKISGSDTDLMSEFSVRYLRY